MAIIEKIKLPVVTDPEDTFQRETRNALMALIQRMGVAEADIAGIDTTGGGGSLVVRKNSGADVGTRPRVNFIEGSNVTLTVADDGTDDEVDVTIAAASAGEANTASNVGGEKEVFKAKSGVDLQFRTIKAGSGITLTQNVSDITVAASTPSNVSDGDKGDISVSGGTWTIDAGVVTKSKMADIGTDRLLGRDTAASGVPEELTVGGGLEFTGTGGIQVATGGVTLAKMADLATDRLIGRDTAGTGAPEALTVGGGLEFSGSGGIQRSALSGDVSASAGSNTTAIGANKVTDAMLRQSAALSVIGRSANSVGNVADISGPSDGDVLARSGSSLVWSSRVSALEAMTIGIFGDGSDGALNFDGSSAVTGASRSGTTYTLTRDIFASSITIASGVTVLPAGFRIFCTGDLANEGNIHRDGSAGGDANGSGSGGTAGTAQASAGGSTLGAGSNGGSGGNNGAGAPSAAGTSGVCPWGFDATAASGGTGAGVGGGVGHGGAGGGNTSTAGGAGGSVAVNSYAHLQILTCALEGRNPGSSFITGGSGGGGGRGGNPAAADNRGGGGGGGGGGCIVIFSYTFSGSGTISAAGGNGGNGGTAAGASSPPGDGGGGGGGWIVAARWTGSAPNASALGGTGGAGSSGPNGGDGGDGLVFHYLLGPA